MATILIADENRQIENRKDISAFLKPFGIYHERWPLEERVDPNASQEEILSAYAPELKVLMDQGGYVTADVINVTAETPNLEAMLDRFRKEHTHSEDEVRFILKGRGLFHIHPKNGPVFAIQVEAGDLINVPKGTQHWFDLCGEKTIRAIRLFQDKSGWTPAYVDEPVHERYQPLCFGPTHLPAGTALEPLIKT
jgi:1,2-dihydroxy-3-keto-5-methylthiopentene dioxygenase